VEAVAGGLPWSRASFTRMLAFVVYRWSPFWCGWSRPLLLTCRPLAFVTCERFVVMHDTSSEPGSSFLSRSLCGLSLGCATEVLEVLGYEIVFVSLRHFWPGNVAGFCRRASLVLEFLIDWLTHSSDIIVPLSNGDRFMRVRDRLCLVAPFGPGMSMAFAVERLSFWSSS